VLSVISALTSYYDNIFPSLRLLVSVSTAGIFYIDIIYILYLTRLLSSFSVSPEFPFILRLGERLPTAKGNYCYHGSDSSRRFVIGHGTAEVPSYCQVVRSESSNGQRSPASWSYAQDPIMVPRSYIPWLGSLF
jgi:hypothetical protein